MKHRSFSKRAKVGFRPKLEQSEQRLLLSAGGLAHADVSRAVPAADVSDADAYYLTQGLGNTTAIYSISVLNKTGHTLDVVSITATSPNIGDAQLEGSLASGGDIGTGNHFLLFTNDKAGVFTVDMTVAMSSNNITTSKVFHVKADGMKTDIAKGYLFYPSSGWFGADINRSKHWKVVVNGTGSDAVLKVKLEK